jgi:hypothetical protein
MPLSAHTNLRSVACKGLVPVSRTPTNSQAREIVLAVFADRALGGRGSRVAGQNPRSGDTRT